MHRSALAASAAPFKSLSLPFNVPRESWPHLLEQAAAALLGERHDAEALAVELFAIAAALKGGAA